MTLETSETPAIPLRISRNLLEMWLLPMRMTQAMIETGSAMLHKAADSARSTTGSTTGLAPVVAHEAATIEQSLDAAPVNFGTDLARSAAIVS